MILGLVGQLDCFIRGELGTGFPETRGAVFSLGDAGSGDRLAGDIGSDFGTKITDAKESSESTLVSLWRLLSFDESEPEMKTSVIKYSYAT